VSAIRRWFDDVTAQLFETLLSFSGRNGVSDLIVVSIEDTLILQCRFLAPDENKTLKAAEVVLPGVGTIRPVIDI
jgi:hypothetical protein